MSFGLIAVTVIVLLVLVAFTISLGVEVRRMNSEFRGEEDRWET